MKVIAGLGNPGARYEGTRHNAGFSVIDRLADVHGIRVNEHKHKALCGTGMIGGEKVILVKPQTYMNLSGESLRPIMDYYKLTPSDILVIYDDISMELGQLRIRLKGSAGGHNGIKSIIAQLGSDAFPRIKCGVGGKPERMDLADYVLGHFSSEEKKEMEEEVRLAAEAAETLISRGAAEAMNLYNGGTKREKVKQKDGEEL